MFQERNKGFTLIELLVVIAIISLLSSIVTASLNSARQRAKDSAIKQGVNQMRLLLEQNLSDYGSYTNLQPNLWYPNTACSTLSGAGNYGAQAASICANLISTMAMPSNWTFIFGLTNSVSQSNAFSIMAYLPYKNTYYCVGSSGRNSDISVGGDGTPPGCSSNP